MAESYAGEVFLLMPMESLGSHVRTREATPCNCPACGSECFLINKLARMAMAKNPKMAVACFSCNKTL